MATDVDSLVSAMSGMTSPTIRPRAPIEIIDVDSFDPQALPVRRQRRPVSRNNSTRRPNPSETIYLIDSDDEAETLPSRALSGHGADRGRSHRQFISPPPLRTDNEIPPLPTRGWQAIPATDRRGSNPLPVLPNPRRFFFEASPSPPAAGPSNTQNQEQPLAAAPTSRHVPALGFGGALISSNNRAQSLQRHARAAAAAAPGSNRRRPAITNLRQPAQFLSNLHDDLFGDDVPPHIRLYLQARNSIEGALGDWNPANHISFLKNAGVREKEPYQQHYTHPFQPEPGFTFDFALPTPEDDVARSRLFPPTSIDKPIILDDDDEEKDVKKHSKPLDPGPSEASTSASTRASSPGAGTLNAVLVCARCLEPLVLNAGLAPEEAQYKRVWGLRCGHLIDEKCLNEIGQPPVEEQPQKDKKGKGKAKAASPRATYGDAVPELQSLVDAESNSGPANNIRSRLRSRLNISSTSTSNDPSGLFSSTASSSSSSSSSSDNHPPPPKRRRGPNKKPKIEGEFEWNCPVSGCGRVHVSVKIDGIWGPETERDFKGVKGLKTEARGAVAVFA